MDMEPCVASRRRANASYASYASSSSSSFYASASSPASSASSRSHARASMWRALLQLSSAHTHTPRAKTSRNSARPDLGCPRRRRSGRRRSDRRRRAFCATPPSADAPCARLPLSLAAPPPWTPLLGPPSLDPPPWTPLPPLFRPRHHREAALPPAGSRHCVSRRPPLAVWRGHRRGLPQ